MVLTVEISLYPLQDNYLELIVFYRKAARLQRPAVSCEPVTVDARNEIRAV